jgi:hypothetical protein
MYIIGDETNIRTCISNEGLITQRDTKITSVSVTITQSSIRNDAQVQSSSSKIDSGAKFISVAKSTFDGTFAVALLYNAPHNKNKIKKIKIFFIQIKLLKIIH